MTVKMEAAVEEADEELNAQKAAIQNQVQQFMLDSMRKKAAEIERKKREDHEKMMSNIGTDKVEESSYASEEDSDDEKPKSKSAASVSDNKLKQIEEAKAARASMGENRQTFNPEQNQLSLVKMEEKKMSEKAYSSNQSGKKEGEKKSFWSKFSVGKSSAQSGSASKKSAKKSSSSSKKMSNK